MTEQKKLIIPGMDQMQATLERAMTPLMAERYKAQRINQYLLDRVEALASPVDPKNWVTFGLRWGLMPPPKGWEDTTTLEIVMHKVRLSLDRTSPEDKLESALWLQLRNVPLPASMSIVNGELHGAAYIDPTTQGGTA